MANDLTLYYTPGACSLSPHIALREADLVFQLSRIDLKTKKLADGGDWLAINPKGYVPALRLPDGQVLTEGAIIVQYIADLQPDARLIPPAGTLERYRMQETLHFIATELHKGMSPLYSSIANEEFKANVRERICKRSATSSARCWRGSPNSGSTSEGNPCPTCCARPGCCRNFERRRAGQNRMPPMAYLPGWPCGFRMPRLR